MSFPPYADYKDSGVAWLGAVPKHWKVDRISRLYRLVGSGTTPSSDQAFDGGTVNWVTTGELREQPIFSTAKQVTQNAVENLSALQVYEAGTLLIAMYGATIGRLGWLEAPACTNQACCAMANPIGVRPRFSFYCLSVATEALMLLSSGGGQPNINQEKIRAFRLPVPPLTEQEAIAAFLDRETAKIDGLVAEQERLIALLKEQRQAVISHTVTKGLNPDAPLKDSGIEWLGQIPAHWEAVPLKYLVSLRSGGTPSKENLDFWDGDIPWASAKDLKADVLDDTIDHLTSLAIDAGAATLHPAGVVLVLVRGMMLARMFPVCETAVPMAINQDLKAVLPGPRIEGPFLAWLLRGTADETLNRLDEAGHGTKALRMEAWTSMALPLPSLDEQRRIATHLGSMTQTIDDLTGQAQSAITLLQERRAALISAAVTGKIDVRATLPQDNVVSIRQAAAQPDFPSLRAVVGAYAIRALGPKGRMAVMKGGFLAEAHAGLHGIGGHYERYAAGPYDRNLIDAMEQGAHNAFDIQTIEATVPRGPTIYRFPKGFSDPSAQLTELVGAEKAKAFQAMLALLTAMDREGVEAVATLYSVWNDLLASGQDATEDAICHDFLTNWDPEKPLKFKKPTLIHWLDWMRRHGFVPDGTAPRTDHQGDLFA